jgi:predicted dehydrogenase
VRAKPKIKIPVKVALVGYGYWGPNLARCIATNERAKLAAICEPSSGRAKVAHSDYPRVPVVSKIETVLRHPDITAVVLATPIDTHCAFALRALTRGKHVLVEKPLASSLAEAETLARAGAWSSCVLMIDHTYLFSAAFETIRRLIADHRLGPLRYYQSTRTNRFGPLHDTNVLWDLAVHDLSILDVLMGSPPSLIRANALSITKNHEPSRAQLTVAYPGNAFASVLVSWVSRAKRRVVTFGFDNHTIVWDDLSPSPVVKLFHIGLERIGNSPKRLESDSFGENISVPPTEPLASMMNHFLDCIAQRVQPRSNVATGVRVVRQLEAAERSLASSGRPLRPSLQRESIELP